MPHCGESLLLTNLLCSDLGLGLRMQFAQLKRREFVTLLGGALVAWPLAVRAQQVQRMRRVGMLLPAAAEDSEFQAWVGAFLQALAIAGWTIGSNLRIETRWGTANINEIRRQAAELVALAPDVILTHGAGPVAALLQITRSIPIVFPIASDPVAGGLVDNLARPGGNVTGFSQFEFSISGKWLELLKEIAPTLAHAAVLRDPVLGTGTSQFAVIQALAPTLRVEISPINMRNAEEVEQSVENFARIPNGGLIVTAGGVTLRLRDLIIGLAAQHKLPAIYWDKFYVAAGGLMSYGPSVIHQYRRAAEYVDRILKGEKPADLPVQAPTKYELVINLKTARTLGLELPATLLARADEVIE